MRVTFDLSALTYISNGIYHLKLLKSLKSNVLHYLILFCNAIISKKCIVDAFSSVIPWVCGISSTGCRDYCRRCNPMLLLGSFIVVYNIYNNIYIYTYTYTYMHTHIHTHTHIYFFFCRCRRIDVKPMYHWVYRVYKAVDDCN